MATTKTNSHGWNYCCKTFTLSKLVYPFTVLKNPAVENEI